MTRSIARFAAPLIACAALIGAALAACKQSEGERCQVNDDCDIGLVCNQATHECARSGTGGGIDALPPIIVDAPADAAVDMPPD